MDFRHFYRYDDRAEEVEMIEKEPAGFQSGEDLATFLEPIFPITEIEGNKLIGYMEGHGFILGQKDGELYRGNLCPAQEETLWETYSVDDAINDAFEWNDELIRETRAAVVDSENTAEIKERERELVGLREDERILDAMFERTKYGKELDILAEILAEELIRDMCGEGGIDAAVEKLAAQIKAGEDLLPEVSPALKKNVGRSR